MEWYAAARAPDEETKLETEASHVQEPAPRNTVIEQPTDEQRQWHALTHVPYKSWCPECVAGRGRDEPHSRQQERDNEYHHPVVEVDYTFAKTADSEEVITCLTAVDNGTGRSISVKVLKKGASDSYVVNRLSAFIVSLAHEHVKLRGDPEPSIRALINAVVAITPRCVPQYSPRASKPSLGQCERMHGVHAGIARSLLMSVERRYGVKIPVRHVLVEWALRHAAWLHERFQPHRIGGMTAFQKHEGHVYTSLLVEFAEVVLWREPGPHKLKLTSNYGWGVWVGRHALDNSHLLLTRQGALAARSVRRLPPAERVQLQLLLAVRGSPRHTEGAPEDKVELQILPPEMRRASAQPESSPQ
eukprot:1130344-Amphidinium_carterae.1